MTAVPESQRPLQVTVESFPSEDPISKARGIYPALTLDIVTLLLGPCIEVQLLRTQDYRATQHVCTASAIMCDPSRANALT